MSVSTQSNLTKFNATPSFKAVSLTKALAQTAQRDFALAVGASRKVAQPAKRIVMTTREYLLSQAGRFYWNNIKHVAMNAGVGLSKKLNQKETIYAAA